VGQWGYDYLKNDFLVYGFPELKNADLLLLQKGEVEGAVPYPRVNREITPAEAYREGVRAIRESAGSETFIMGCGTPLFHTAGFVDAARVGGDIQSKLCVSWAVQMFTLLIPSEKSVSRVNLPLEPVP